MSQKGFQYKDEYYDDTGYCPDIDWDDYGDTLQGNMIYPDEDFCDEEPIIGKIPQSSGKKRIALAGERPFKNKKGK